LVYNVLPLDLTISVVEIFHKWQDGRVNLIPFGRLPPDPVYAMYEVATDALIWVPLALLWRLDAKRGPWRAWAMTLVTAATLEAMQLFVFSRVSDVTDVFTAAAGAAVGIAVGSRLKRERARRDDSAALDPRSAPATQRWMPFALSGLWIAALAFVFWFPFDFRTDGAFVRSRLDFVLRVPFEVYYFGTEYRAITEVLRKTLFFAPLGALLAWGVAAQPWRLRKPLRLLSMLVLVAMPAVIELGQVMLPHKIADTTDWFLAWAGGLAGYGLARRFARAPRFAGPRRAEPAGRGTDTGVTGQRTPWHFALTVGGLAFVLWGAAHASFVPYNVRELLQQDSPALSALLLALTCYWIAAWPVWLARRRLSGAARLVQLPLGLFAYGLVVFLLLQAAVPEESLHDLVGSPVLGLPGQWETGLRWIALAAAPGALLYLAAQSVRRWRGLALGAVHFWAAIPVLIVAYWAVVGQAATDNLVELVAEPRPLAFAALCGALYAQFVAAAMLASPRFASGIVTRLGAVALSLPLAAVLVHLGLAAEIDKYGERFSALQFLLSADRQHYAALPEIWLRYGAVHLLVIAGLAFIQWPHFRTARRSHARASDVSY
jgi:glycopeptide antibiotics resistance protein